MKIFDNNDSISVKRIFLPFFATFGWQQSGIKIINISAYEIITHVHRHLSVWARTFALT